MTMSDFSIFNDPPTQADIDSAYRAARQRLTTGEKIALYTPFAFGLEFVAGAAVDAIKGDNVLGEGKGSEWNVQPGAISWDWSKSVFTESYAKKVRAMNRELVRGEVSAMTRQIYLEDQALSAVKDAGKMAGNIAEAILSGFGGKK